MRKGIGWMVERGLGFVTAGRKKAEVEKMRKGLSIIAGIAILLFAYSASAAVVTSNLVSWWKFDETSGTTAYDTGGSATNNGTLNGGCTWTTDTAGSASSGALYLDGVYLSHVDCGSDMSMSPTNVTVEAWVKFDSTTAGVHHGIVGKFTTMGGIQHGYIMWVHASDVLGCRVGENTNSTDHAGTTDIQDDSWHQVAMTYDGSYIRFFLDGQAEGTALSYTNGIEAADYPLTIGARHESGWDLQLKGIIDDVRIYDRALGQSEIEQNYNAIPEPSTLLLLGGGLLSLLAFRRIKAKV